MARLRVRARGTAAFDADLPDRSAARALSAALPAEERLSFARRFTAAAVAGFWRELTLSGNAHHGNEPPPRLGGSPLTQAAEQAALATGAAIATTAPAEAAGLLGGVYTSLLPETFRSAHGIFYTPPALVDRLLRMAEAAGADWRTARVLDPACGGGAFLAPIARRMAAALGEIEPSIVLHNIGARLRGFDLDPFGAWLAQVTAAAALQDLAKAAGRPVPQMSETRDSLELRPQERSSFDLVIGNPPYGRITLPPPRRAQFARSVYGHANLYGVFTDAALHWAKPGGVIGYVTPTSMLSGLYYKALRRLLATEAPPLAIDFVSERSGVFADALQETMLATYRRGDKAQFGEVGFIALDRSGTSTLRNAGTFALPAAADSPWLVPRSPDRAALTERLRAMPHRLRDYGYRVATGPLVWNRFKGQFRDGGGKDRYPVVWAESVTSDGRFHWRSEKRNHAPWFGVDRPKDDWLIVRQPCVLLQRTTAKEQARRLIAAELPASFVREHDGVIVENHLNMVRAAGAEPAVSTAVIAALLNSALADAAFRCINGSVAVSAFELEELPLPALADAKRLETLIASGAPRSAVDAAIAGMYGEDDASGPA